MQKGSSVFVTFAAPVPQVVGLTHNQAEARVRAMTFRMDHGGDPSPTAPIINQIPAPGALLRLGRSVWVTFEDLVVVPDLINLPLSAARQRLQQARLGIVTHAEIPAGDPKVESQNPSAGTRVRPGTKVGVGFSTVVVPDVIAQTGKDAVNILQKIGLKVNWLSPSSGVDLDEYIVKIQEPAAGTKVAKGAVVNLTLMYGSRSFGYQGNVIINGVVVPELRANLQVKVAGLKVTGSLEAQPVCETNRRLFGAYVRDFKGTLSGPWEKDGTILWGSYSDGAFVGCPDADPRTGLFTIWSVSGNVYLSTTNLYYNNFFFGRFQGGPTFPTLPIGKTFPPPPKGKFGGGGPTFATGTVWVSDGETTKPGASVRIIVGKNLNLRYSAGVDILENGSIVAETTTDANGNYKIPLPTGKTYYVLAWKRDYTPVQGSIAAPGTRNFQLTKVGTLTTDVPHNSLDTSGTKTSGPEGGGDGDLVNGGNGLPDSAEEDSELQEWTKENVGPFSLALPKGWINRGDRPPGQGRWYVGNAEEPEASFSVLQLKTGQKLLDQLKNIEKSSVILAGRKAERYQGRTRTPPNRRQIVVIFSNPQADGFRFVLLAEAPETQWERYQPLFHRLLEQIQPRAEDQGEPKPSGRIVGFARIKDFQADFRYTAFHDGIVIVQKSGGRKAVVWAEKRPFLVEGRFETLLQKNSDLAEKLGQPESEETALFDGALWVQIFEGGAILHETSSGTNWWNWHGKRQPGSPTAYELPNDPQSPVITLDYRGGLTPPRKNEAPYLAIYADRRAVVQDPWGRHPPLEDKVSARSFPDFFRFAIEEHEFFDIDSKELANAIAAAAADQGGMKIMDGATTILRIRTRDEEHEVRCYALSQYAEFFPHIRALAKLSAIEQRLVRFMEGIKADAK